MRRSSTVCQLSEPRVCTRILGFSSKRTTFDVAAGPHPRMYSREHRHLSCRGARPVGPLLAHPKRQPSLSSHFLVVVGATTISVILTSSPVGLTALTDAFFIATTGGSVADFVG